MTAPRPRRVTQADIARHAGVSTAVVSLVLNDAANGSVKIAKSTQERVRASIRELGYVPNTAARQLAGGRTNVVAVFTYEPMFPLKANNFYHNFLVGVEEGAARLGYNLLLLTGNLNHGKRQIYDQGTNRLLAAEGAILLGTNENRDELRRLWDDQYPFVFVGRREIDGVNIPASAAGYAAASENLVERFIATGHQCIAMLHGINGNESSADRLLGVRAAVSRHADVGYHEHADDPDADVSAEWLQSRLDLGVTAVICENMRTAVRLRTTAEQMGIVVPRDLSIASLGNADNPWVQDTGITTFSIPQREMGETAMELLAMRLNGQPLPPQPVTIPCTFFPGHTLASPRVAKGGA